MSLLIFLIDVIVVFSLLILAFVSLTRRGYRNPINRLFTVFSVIVALWVSSSYMGGDANLSKDVALVSNYITFAAALAAVILLMQFVVGLAGAVELRKAMRYFLIPLWGLCLICFTPLVVGDIVLRDDTYAIISGPLLGIYFVGLLLTFVIIAYGMAFGLRYAIGDRKRQLVAIGIGLIITLPAVILLNFIIPIVTGMFYISKFGIAPVVILVISVYYGVVRYRLFDIRLAAARTGAYVLSLITLSFIYYYLAYVVSFIFFQGNVNTSVSISPMNIALALLLAFVFQPIKKTFDRLTNAIFYKDNYNSDTFFSHINQIATQTTNMGGLLRNSANEIAKTIKIEQVFFVVMRKDDKLIAAGTNHHNRLPKRDIQVLNDYVDSGGQLLDRSFLSGDKSNEEIRKMMISHKVELILPLVISNKLVGYLCLGDKKSGNFTSRDINVLKTASDELSIAIQNALAVQEVRDLNDSLQQKITNATRELRASNAQLQRLDKAKDEFVSMASHQLRTPLTTVKGYLSMVMEGDAGEITAEQRRLLDEAFMSSERMVNLINDFLNISRIQTGKFTVDRHPFDLVRLIEQEIDRLKPNASSRKLEFVFKKPVDFPLVNIDEAKMREVVMNFADNALYYSHEGAKIDINLFMDGDGQVNFTVTDTGIGVPVDEQPRLFSKFYRAGNAKRQRPDGTGVGLFLAKKIIVAHGGKLIFESAEGKGSKFGFSLPVEQSE